MARPRDPRRDEAFEIYKKSNGKSKLKDIAEQLGVIEGTVRGWKNKDSWDEKLNGTFQTKIRNVPNKNPAKKARDPSEKKSGIEKIENDELTEKQRLFCIYYVKSFNATQAAIKATYAPDSAHVEGSRLLRNAKVASEIKRIKSEMTSDLFLEAMDVLKVYVKIAFSDITDYLKFGQKEVPVMTMFGPMKDDDGNEVTKMVSYVEFNESDMVDGTIISEVKQGKDGVGIKFADKMKALDKLSLYFDLFPDKFKRDIEAEKLKIAQFKANGNDEEEYEDDGFLEALDGKEVDWDEET